MNFSFSRTALMASSSRIPAILTALLAVTAVIFAAGAPAQPGPGGPGRPKSPTEDNEGKSSGVGPERAPGSEGRMPGPPRGHGPEGGAGERGDPFSSLSEEEQRRVREVLEKVWQDPAVMAAKEGVRVSTEEYRQALQRAVTRLDPEVAALMNKVHEGSKSADLRKRYEEHMGQWPGGPGRAPGGPGGPVKRPGGGEFALDLPEFVRALDEEKRAIYLEARDKAQASEKIAVLRKDLEDLEKKERASREELFRLLFQMRRAMREEMIRIDPRVEDIVPEFSRSPDNEGGPKGDGEAKGEPKPGEDGSKGRGGTAKPADRG